ATADELGLAFARAATVGTHPAFVAAIRELVEEQTVSAPARWLGRLGICGWECPPGCCVVLTHRP
ncbi:MAG: protoporphyrin/coproporphyrin ferrochelatase, partial [Pseudonocardiales bacterium]|nr:protoporphyrin/coproporphyrin ferrochelatase [Pseudonocardiales bacterium]